MTRRHFTLLGAALTAFVVGAAGPAYADASATIEGVRSDDGALRIVVSINDVSPDAQVDPNSFEATLEGIELDPRVDSLQDDSDITQTVFLVMDTSDSMAGERLEAAQDAAREFADSVPEGVEIGLISFGGTAELLLDPGTDRDQLLDTVDDLSTSPRTALYDAVVLAAEELEAAEIGSVVLLSDGANAGRPQLRGSIASPDEALAAAEDSGARFDVVSFGLRSDQIRTLTQVATTTEGAVYSAASREELTAAFASAAATITNSYVLTAPVPQQFTGASGTVSVSVSVGGARVSDSAFVPVGQETATPDAEEYLPEPVAAGRFAGIPESAAWLALGAIFVALFVLIGVAFTSVAGRDSGAGGGVKRRLSVYTLSGRGAVKEQESTALGDTQVARSAVDFAGRVVAQRDLETLVGGKLEAAGVPLKSAEWLLIHIGTAVGLGLLFLLLSGGDLLPALVGLGFGLLGPWMYLAVKESRRTSAFMSGLPDTLQLIAGSLSAGYSMPQAIDTVVREGRAPISTEFNRALVEARLGVPIEDALDGIATRMRSVDFAWVVMAIKIQREVGGNLAEVLNTVAATLRERERLRRQVQVLSAEGRLSAWILGLLPMVFALYLVLVRPGYLAPLLTNVLGWLMIGTGVVLLAVGALWLRKVVKVEV